MQLQDFIDRLTEIFEGTNPDNIRDETKFREIEGYSSLTAYLIISMVNDRNNKKA